MKSVTPSFDPTHWAENACRDFIYRIRWPDGKCPHCGGDKQWPIDDRRVACASCRKQICVTAGTLLHGSRLPLNKILGAAYFTLATPEGVSARQLQELLGLSRYEPALRLMACFRSAMAPTVHDLLWGRIAVTTRKIPVAGAKADGATVLVACVDRRYRWPHALIRKIPEASESWTIEMLYDYVDLESTILTDGGAEFAWLDGLYGL